MVAVKTGISLDQDLFERITALALALHVSRSEVMSMAVREFLEAHENKLIFERLQSVYGAASDPDDERMLAGMRRLYARAVERDW